MVSRKSDDFALYSYRRWSTKLLQPLETLQTIGKKIQSFLKDSYRFIFNMVSNILRPIYFDS